MIGVEWPVFRSFGIGTIYIETFPVNKELNLIRIPLNRIDMKFLTWTVDRLTLRVLGIAVTRSIMNGSTHTPGSIPCKFHNINLSTTRPANRSNVTPKHPNSRPNTTSTRKLCSDFDFSISKLKKSLSFDPCRRKGGVSIVFAPSLQL